jgi:hypothetical protein
MVGGKDAAPQNRPPAVSAIFPLTEVAEPSPAGRPKTSAQSFDLIGAGDGNRTHDIQLGKLSFYH